MNTALRQLAVGLALAVMPAAVQASVIVQSDAIAFGHTFIRSPGVPLTGALPLLPAGQAVFGKFDTPGTLNSATWTVKGLSMGFNFEHHVRGLAANPIFPVPFPFTLGATGAGDLELSLLLTGVNTASTEFNIVDSGSNVCSGTISTPTELVECLFGTAGNTVIDVSFTVTGSDLGLFKGIGDITVQYFPVAGWVTLPIAGITAPLPFPVSFLSGFFGGQGTLELTYDFTPVRTESPGQAPLPATPLLLAAGLLALMTARRRR